MTDYFPEASALIPTGFVMCWGGTIAGIPSGFLLCNGAALSRTTYSKLFGAIGISHGAGNGTTTFNIPDYRDQFIAGALQDESNQPKTYIAGYSATQGGYSENSFTFAQVCEDTPSKDVVTGSENDGLGANVPPFHVGVWIIKT